jgi:hypothetical protein
MLLVSRVVLSSRLGPFLCEVDLHRFIYPALAEIDHGLEHEPVRWSVRPDFYLPGLAVAVEVKVAGSVGEVRRQVSGYLGLAGVDGVVLVTTSIRHRGVAAVDPSRVAVVPLVVASL